MRKLLLLVLLLVPSIASAQSLYGLETRPDDILVWGSDRVTIYPRTALSLDRYLTTDTPKYVDVVMGAETYLLVEAQTTAINPTVATFDVPSDYATATSFDLEIYRQSDMVMVRTTNFGKGTLNGNTVSTPLQPGNGYANNVVYVFRILENNPLGSTRSVTTSNPFVAGALPVGVSNLRAQ